MLVTDFKRIGDKLQQVRKQAGLSQEETAWQAGLSLRAYADIERGLVNSKFGSILNICKVFHITPDMITTDEEKPASIDYNDIILEIDMPPQREKFAAYSILNAYYQAFMSTTDMQPGQTQEADRQSASDKQSSDKQPSDKQSSDKQSSNKQSSNKQSSDK